MVFHSKNKKLESHQKAKQHLRIEYIISIIIIIIIIINIYIYIYIYILYVCELIFLMIIKINKIIVIKVNIYKFYNFNV